MDHISHTNRERWNALAGANVMYSQPFLDFTREQAAAYVLRAGIIDDVAGTEVLCLAGSGGQDAVAFGLLGARVTVFDLSDIQLSRDREAAAHHGFSVETIQGDMRDLSALPDDRFDVVWQPYSINFSPTVAPVVAGVARVLRPGGVYHLAFANPSTMGLDEESWDGAGYRLLGSYRDGECLVTDGDTWDVELPDGTLRPLPHPLEFRHTLSTMLNTLCRHGFRLLRLDEWQRPDPDPEPGSWAHFTQASPPYLQTYWRLEA